MKSFFKTNSAFLLPYSLFLLAGAVLIFMNSKAETHLEFNRFHTPFFDHFFYYATFLGDGYMATIVGVMLLAVRYRWVIIVGLSNILSALITQSLKHTVFDDVVRPKKFFEGLHDIYLVPNVDNYLYNSFPSGHSTCAFALYFALAVILNNKTLKFICFLLALTAGYSRIYLSQHFFEDVYAGSLIGTGSVLFIYWLFRNNKAAWLDRSLLRFSQN